ncbi:MAG TPA: hypothetical protein VM266_13245 [Solirubrobacteraceae bacterium]|nr:hypothetical protein [Solirubrobacteraceae bacterium]
MTTELPIACSLTATDLRARLAEMRALGRDALLDVRRDGPHALLRFAAAPGVRERVAAIAAAEARCCSFLALRVDVTPGAVTLEATAPAGAEAALVEIVEAFQG